MQREIGPGEIRDFVFHSVSGLKQVLFWSILTLHRRTMRRNRTRSNFYPEFQFLNIEKWSFSKNLLPEKQINTAFKTDF